MTIYRGRVFSPLADPFASADASSYVYFEDGFLQLDGEGRIDRVGAWSDEVSPDGNHETVVLGPAYLITPGFVDTHLHGPQLRMIGSYGGDLLDWLNRHTYPAEAGFADESHARAVATELFEELLRNGTTSSLIFSSVHTSATRIFFEEAEKRGVRAIIGKSLMDRNAPVTLLEQPAESLEQSRALIRQWHGRGLLRYAISPRFAPTSSPALLAVAGQLKREFPDVYFHTHLSENAGEIAWVQELFPEARDYTDVYDRAGLLDERVILAHGVHLTDRELSLLGERQARLAHCPNSNLFLGSGLFPLRKVLAAGIPVGLGSDIGAGTTPSMFNAMADAYKVQQVQGVSISPLELWYLATLGGARVLSLDATCGSLEPKKEGDFLVLDLESTPLMTHRTRNASTIEELLAGLVFMGDDRVIRQAFVQGREVYRRSW